MNNQKCFHTMLFSAFCDVFYFTLAYLSYYHRAIETIYIHLFLYHALTTCMEGTAKSASQALRVKA